jgi:hypothetical protein
MDALAYLANLSTAYKIHSHLKSTINYQDEEELNQRMAIRTNFLFEKNYLIRTLILTSKVNLMRRLVG